MTEAVLRWRAIIIARLMKSGRAYQPYAYDVCSMTASSCVVELEDDGQRGFAEEAMAIPGVAMTA